MENSRVQKYKEYRSSMIKEDSPVLETNPIENSEERSANRNTTSTLPMDQVIDSLKNEEDVEAFDKKEKRRRILIISLIVAGLVVLTAAIIVIGILLWR